MASKTLPAKRKEAMAAFQDENLRILEEEVQATAFAQECRADLEAQQAQDLEHARLRAIEEHKDMRAHYTAEACEVVASVVAGGISTFQPGGVPLGRIINFAAGIAGKYGSAVIPSNRALNVLSRAGKQLLHGQVSIDTRDIINGW
ncbi:hypothetical protein G6O69_21040 [Pseudenhygromyxa sp. WMMC2535]|uniref:hypothetical protein n=1 Tax=Pseudenhygromyxa sp. WMMC2535 TaxID=2712867 RepID=UPI001551B783|nr:hypothetical protein [Pseudenhygromyxa sp. WMMC2535]NVB40339.1 hypothetical protein [Pseudenhygromyxa sp. WMMC2535]